MRRKKARGKQGRVARKKRDKRRDREEEEELQQPGNFSFKPPPPSWSLLVSWCNLFRSLVVFSFFRMLPELVKHGASCGIQAHGLPLTERVLWQLS